MSENPTEDLRKMLILLCKACDDYYGGVEYVPNLIKEVPGLQEWWDKQSLDERLNLK